MVTKYLQRQLLIWKIILVLTACNSGQQPDKKKSVSNTITDNAPLLDSCNKILDQLLEIDESRVIDTLSFEKYYSSETIKRKEINLTYNSLTFHTSNKQFDKQLSALTNSLISKDYMELKKDYFLFRKDETKKEKESGKYRYGWDIEISPVYVNQNSVSLAIIKWSYTGGIHGSLDISYKNYIFRNGKTKILTNYDFINDELNLDTVYFDPIANKVIFEHQKNSGCYLVCFGWSEKIISFKELFSSFSEDSSFSNRYFVFNSDGIKIKYYGDYYGGAQGVDIYDLQDKVIPKKEFQKVASKIILQLWNDSLSKRENSSSRHE